MGLLTPVEQVEVGELGPVHFIAIGGSGMNGVASALLQLGVPVSGSDRQDSKYLRALEAQGARVFVGHAASQLAFLAPVLPTDAAALYGSPPELASRLGAHEVLAQGGAHGILGRDAAPAPPVAGASPYAALQRRAQLSSEADGFLETAVGGAKALSPCSVAIDGDTGAGLGEVADVLAQDEEADAGADLLVGHGGAVPILEMVVGCAQGACHVAGDGEVLAGEEGTDGLTELLGVLLATGACGLGDDVEPDGFAAGFGLERADPRSLLLHVAGDDVELSDP